MDEWMNGWMDEWMNGWLDEWMDGLMDGPVARKWKVCCGRSWRMSAIEEVKRNKKDIGVWKRDIESGRKRRGWEKMGYEKGEGEQEREGVHVQRNRKKYTPDMYSSCCVTLGRALPKTSIGCYNGWFRATTAFWVYCACIHVYCKQKNIWRNILLSNMSIVAPIPQECGVKTVLARPRLILRKRSRVRRGALYVRL